MRDLPVARGAVFAVILVSWTGYLLPGVAVSQDCSAGERAFEHAAGTDCIPIAPERIVTLHDGNALLPLRELGVKPVGSSGQFRFDDQEPFFRNLQGYDTSGVLFVGQHRNESVELVASLAPDLIIATPSPDWHYHRFSRIAPTVVIDMFDQTMQSALRQFAAAVGKTKRAKQIEAQFDAHVAHVRSTLGAVGCRTTALVVSHVNDTLRTVPWVHGYGAAFDALGFHRTEWEKSRRNPDQVVEISLEAFVTVKADVIFVVDLTGAEGPGGDYETLVSKPLLQVIEVGRADQIFELDGALMGGTSWLRTMNAIDQLSEILSSSEFDAGLVRESGPVSCP